MKLSDSYEFYCSYVKKLAEIEVYNLREKEKDNVRN